jgi:DNA-directed RNA polymerase subunit beta'
VVCRELPKSLKLESPKIQRCCRSRRYRRNAQQNRKRGKRTIIVRSDQRQEASTWCLHGKRFLVHSGDIVKAGQALVDGPLVPHDILRVSGEEAVQQYLLHEIQQVYRLSAWKSTISTVEIIIARMLRKVKIERGRYQPVAWLGHGPLRVPSSQHELAKCCQDHRSRRYRIRLGVIVPKEAFETSKRTGRRLGWQACQGQEAKASTRQVLSCWVSPRRGSKQQLYLGRSFQETTKVLTEAALAGKVDKLVGLKGERHPGSLDSRRVLVSESSKIPK